MEKRGARPKGKVKIEWSPNFSYAIGLLASDGSLSKDGRHINFTSKDKEQVITFKSCLGLGHIKLGRKGSGSSDEKKYFQIQFGDILFYRWLVDIGITPNKSKTIHSIKIPSKYFFDFLRGCFDGDGSMYAYWDPRWKSSYMFYLQLTSSSRDFLYWLQKSIYRHYKIQGRLNTSGRNTYQLRFAKTETLKLFKKMYYSNNIPYLKRKFTKAQKIFRIDKKHNNAQVLKLVDRLG
tara:strand:+ start:8387 stop:9091 length:705 start_codon:yes stop_codon:yes gene_type:complete